MYFGALSVGADLCVGLIAFHHINLSKKKLVVIFKDFKINFLKKATSDVHFVCEEGKKVAELVTKVIKTGERQNLSVHGYATTPKVSGNEIIAEFDLTLSIK